MKAFVTTICVCFLISFCSFANGVEELSAVPQPPIVDVGCEGEEIHSESSEKLEISEEDNYELRPTNYELEKEQSVDELAVATQDEPSVDVPVKEDNYELRTTNYEFKVTGYFAPAFRLAYKSTISIGPHVGVNFNIKKGNQEFSVGPYIHGEYFFSPFGVSTGEYIGREVELEAGANITYPFFKTGKFALKIGCDIGYYMQWLEYNSLISNSTHLSYNGLMLRPTFTIQFYELWNMPIALSLYYQVTAIMPYADYNGFGLMVTL